MNNEGKKFMSNQIDIHVGSKLRFLRIAAGMSQEDLANELHVSYQQVQKYESMKV